MGSGDTETGAYTLSPGFPPPVSSYTIKRNPGTRWFLPNESEWYKAAFYDAGSDAYYDYYSGSNHKPNNNLPAADTGNSANYRTGITIAGLTTGDLFYPLTDVGAYALSPSPYGTFDQGGNVSEWTETLHDSQFRVLRGGYWFVEILPAEHKNYPSIVPAEKHAGVGFRLAVLVPEPHGLLLVGAASLIMVIYRFHRTRHVGVESI
jgi:formylglycine-generating enzyme